MKGKNSIPKKSDIELAKEKILVDKKNREMGAVAEYDKALKDICKKFNVSTGLMGTFQGNAVRSNRYFISN